MTGAAGKGEAFDIDGERASRTCWMLNPDKPASAVGLFPPGYSTASGAG